ncbi:hypothetical protein FOCC_FOCC002558, partial [Frankliniella occidentalis]
MAEEAARGSTAEAASGAAEAVAVEAAGVEEPAAGAGTRARRMRELLAEQHEVAVQEPAEVRALREATTLIQTHERARQNRIQSFNRRRWMQQRYQQPTAKKDRPDPDALDRAAVTLQRHVRGHQARKRVRKYREREDTLIGMLMPRAVDYSYRARVEEVRALRRALRRDLQAAYEAAVAREHEWVDRELSPDIFDDLGDEMREWIRSWWYDVLKLPKYPPERERKLVGALLGLPKRTPKGMFPDVDPTLPGIPPRKLGGSNLVTAEFWCTSTEFKQVAELLARNKKGKGKGQGKPKLTREEKREQRQKRREAKRAEKQRHLAEKLTGFQLEESAVMPALAVAEREYRVVGGSPHPTHLRRKRNQSSKFNLRAFSRVSQDWEFVRPDDENPSEDPYTDLIRVDEVHAKQFELRQVIDDLMRVELEKLKDAVWREKHKRRKGRRKRRKGKRKKKKRGKRKRRGKKKKKDPTADKTPDELLEALVRAGVVRNSREARMEDFFGEPAYANFELRERCGDPLPALGDIRQAVREFCVLPLGSARAHELAPLVKSTGALRMDLTPEAVAAARARYPGKKEWKLFLHTVNKVARLLAPTVIVMDDAHRNYYKRVPKPERALKPKKFARTLKKIVKGIKRPDRVLVLGTSNAPWLARGRKLVKAYQRHVFVPPLDYGSRALLWHQLIMQHKAVARDFEVTSGVSLSASDAHFLSLRKSVTPLAHVTPWVPYPTIREVVERALGVERRIHLASRPLRHQEILDLLLEYPNSPTVK